MRVGHGATAVLLLAGFAAIASGCSSAPGLSPSASVTTTTLGWEHYFKLDWDVEPGTAGARRITGYIYNEYGRPATRVQILAQAFDPAGQLVGQRLVWIPGDVPALDRSYFEVDLLPAADHYRVSVWSFDYLLGGHHGIFD